MKEFIYITLGNSRTDFSKLDLSPWNIAGGKIMDAKTKEAILESGLIANNWNIFENESLEMHRTAFKNNEYRNILWPLNKDNPPSEKDYIEIVDILRMLYPSELYIENIFYTDFAGGFGRQIHGWKQLDTYASHRNVNFLEHIFHINQQQIENLNNFLPLVKEKIQIDYINNALKYYSNFYTVNSAEMSFICLCICLETIVPGREQLTYKFRRNLAVLCSDSIFNGKVILNNAKKIYNLRSDLVHAGKNKNSNDKFESILYYTLHLASQMIIEMILHGIPKIIDLDKKITELGLGDRNKISVHYEDLHKEFEFSNYNLLKEI